MNNTRQYFQLKIAGLERQLPIVALGPKVKIASFNLLGDGELVEKLAEAMAVKITGVDFDYLVGPEVKVVPLLQALSQKLGKPRHVVLRKQIMGYMTEPVLGRSKPTLVINGPDAALLKGNKVLLMDDVVSTGSTLRVVENLMDQVGAQIVGVAAIFKQGNLRDMIGVPFYYLGELPLF